MRMAQDGGVDKRTVEMEGGAEVRAVTLTLLEDGVLQRLQGPIRRMEAQVLTVQGFVLDGRAITRGVAQAIEMETETTTATPTVTTRTMAAVVGEASVGAEALGGATEGTEEPEETENHGIRREKRRITHRALATLDGEDKLSLPPLPIRERQQSGEGQVVMRRNWAIAALELGTTWALVLARPWTSGVLITIAEVATVLLPHCRTKSRPKYKTCPLTKT